MNSYKIKDYCVEHNKIGAGAFSTIHKAYKEGNDKIYAVKKIDIYKYKNNKETYKREFTLLRKLDHKNIIKLHDIIIDTRNQNLFLVLDYYQNGDFANFLNNRSLKEKYAKNYMFQLRDGLHYLFSKNIIHRDLKPQNLLLDENKSLIITDFGLAKHFKSNEMLETVCGSPLYMAPEIIAKKNYTIQSDLWSVGIILYQMIYGKVPYLSKNLVGLIREHKTKKLYYDSPYVLSDSCKKLIKDLLIIDSQKRINWDNFFNNEWFGTNEVLENQNKLMEISLSNYSTMINNNNDLESQFNSFIYRSIQEQNNSFELYLNDDDSSESSESESESTEDIIEPSSNEISKTVSLPINIKNTYIVVNKNVRLPNSEPLNNQSLSESFKEYLSHSIEFVKNSYEYLCQS
mgnify:CR=1 FL=1|tara:strand:+ start:212 stop:1417 length:1206 start_codon:yes stop_codon:yes gene_type:complete